MFDFLKKKISGFIDTLTKKEEEAPEARPAEEEKPEVLEGEPKIEAPVEEAEAPVAEAEIPKPEIKHERPKPEIKPPKPEPEITKPPKFETPKPLKIEIPKPETRKPAKPETEVPKPVKHETIKEIAQPKPPAAKETKPPGKPKIEEKKPKPSEPAKIEKVREPVKAPPPPKPQIAKPTKPIEPPEREMEVEEIESRPPVKEIVKEKPEIREEKKEKERIKLGAITALKSFITREVEIGEPDVKDLLDNLELELLEADVDMDVAGAIKEELRKRLVGSRIGREKLHTFIGGAIKEALIEVITNDKAFDIVERIESLEKPAKIVFLGINGTGKTTTIAKVAKLLMDRKKKVIFAAADTFRAAAIEQIGVHADRLGVKVIKREYGSDPTSVAYDAVNYAKAHGIDAVLIDTAGRQDTNISLINEMKKMDRVIVPDLKIYIGESIAGNAIIEQISSFNREIGIDAVILTKLDCDPKGGTMLSINRTTGIPIIYIGTGQAYDDLELFDARSMVERIVG